METQYTPGPWHAGGITVYGGSGARLTVADTTCSGSMTRAEDEANAQLIAAAPDLLNMLRRIVDECIPYHFTPDGIRASAPCLLTLEHARAAITKAKGETK